MEKLCVQFLEIKEVTAMHKTKKTMYKLQTYFLSDFVDFQKFFKDMLRIKPVYLSHTYSSIIMYANISRGRIL